MNLRYCLNQLSTHAAAIGRLVENIDGDQARWKPGEEQWSILEVVNHLLDEEREDFRARLQHLLSGSVEPWPPIAPQRWVTERDYNRRDLGESLAGYLEERQRSLDWLGQLSGADWGTRYRHPPLQGLSAGDLLVSWAAHDLLHLRQLVELKWGYGRVQGAPYSADYAGDR
jgi:hypothetical protein